MLTTIFFTKKNLRADLQKETWQPLGPLLKVKPLVGYM